MSTRAVMQDADISRALTRISHEIIESNRGAGELVLLGIPTRGVPLAERIAALIRGFTGQAVPVGSLDVTMYRDDLHRNPTRTPHPTRIPDSGIDGKTVVLVDDVLFSGGASAQRSMPCKTSAGQQQCASRSSWTADTASCRSGRTSWARTCRAPDRSTWRSAFARSTARTR